VSCKNGIPYSQGKRYRRIISGDNVFNDSLQNLHTYEFLDNPSYFKERNYPINVIDNVFSKVSCLTQDEALSTNNKTSDGSVIPFIVEYNSTLPYISNIIKNYWDLLQLSSKCSVQKLHESKPLVAFKRPINLKDILVNSNVRSYFFNNKNVKCPSKCNRSICTHCSSIIESNTFSSTNIPGKNYHVNNNTDCSTKCYISCHL
jgi:hypothetical protein